MNMKHINFTENNFRQPIHFQLAIFLKKQNHICLKIILYCLICGHIFCSFKISSDFFSITEYVIVQNIRYLNKHESLFYNMYFKVFFNQEYQCFKNHHTTSFLISYQQQKSSFVLLLVTITSWNSVVIQRKKSSL